MLELHDIQKEYATGEDAVHALKGVSIAFRPHEFVAILGPSGCGKTTLLNIIGGLDHYTSGDLQIDGISTKQYEDADWDVYRNHRIGFVFQSYNLIPHQTVLSNVELALTLSGVSKAERRERAIAALTKVGLGDQIKKKPTQMSGGQMQRVAIARALVNDPQIVLADEPTGALDTGTSEQIMEILKEISQDKLIVMVTHNPDLAERYATRTISMLDGAITGDTDPYTEQAHPQGSPVPTIAPAAADKKDKGATRKKKTRKNKTSMSFFTALSLSLNNLLTKKARTLLTSFAGSIGIIGIALILALSNGIQVFIDKVQEDTLSSYPLTIENTTMDFSSLLSTMTGNSEALENPEDGYIYPNNQLTEIAGSVIGAVRENDLASFKEYLEKDTVNIREYATVQYKYGVTPLVWTTQNDGSYLAVNPSRAYQTIMDFMGNSGMSMDGWTELLDNETLLKSQFDLVYGAWPTAYNEVVLIADENNRITDLAIYSLGLRDPSELEDILSGKEVPQDPNERFRYEDLVGIDLTLLLAADCYMPVDVNDPTKGCVNITKNQDTLAKALLEKGISLKISGIIRQNPDATAVSASGIIGYTSLLTEHIAKASQDTAVAQLQINNPSIDVITGKYFPDNKKTEEEKAAELMQYISFLSLEEKSTWYTESLPSLLFMDLVAKQSFSMMEDPRYPNDKTGIQHLQEDIRHALETQEGLLEALGTMIGYDLSEANETYKKIIINMIVNGCGKYEDALKMMATVNCFTTDETTGVTLYEGALVAKMAEIAMLPTVEDKVANMEAYLETLDTVVLATFWDEFNPDLSENSYRYNCRLLGIVDLDAPTSINLYPHSFQDKEEITRIIDEYNASREIDSEKVVYTDYIGIMLSSISTILDVITYVLVGFVAISLVVSSIMIGIITYISVLERTKEIGILRAIGASKKDVSNVFLAESMIVGFGAGLMGILVTLLLCIPVNIIIRALSGYQNLGASLPLLGAILLVAVSVLLTFVAGAIPARIAAKKEPVEALRTE